jgi:hypothetical protein
VIEDGGIVVGNWTVCRHAPEYLDIDDDGNVVRRSMEAPVSARKLSEDRSPVAVVDPPPLPEAPLPSSLEEKVLEPATNAGMQSSPRQQETVVLTASEADVKVPDSVLPTEPATDASQNPEVVAPMPSSEITADPVAVAVASEETDIPEAVPEPFAEGETTQLVSSLASEPSTPTAPSSSEPQDKDIHGTPSLWPGFNGAFDPSEILGEFNEAYGKAKASVISEASVPSSKSVFNRSMPPPIFAVMEEGVD